MELTKNFKELNKNDALIAGGKGASLGEMTQAGIPVPPGFVILSTTFDRFIKDADLIQEIDSIIDKVNHKDISSVELASEKIQTLIKNATMPKDIEKEIKKQFKQLDTEFVAVRSSATAEDGAENAWAGQLDSFLNTKEDDLLEKVQQCWASLFTPRAIFYRFEKGLHNTKISVAVVIQKMVNSEISGIAFSVHPVTEDKNQMIIEAGFGLGEAIVSGKVTPDSYVIEKEPRRIIDINVSSQTRALYRVQAGGNEWIDISEPKASSQVLTEVQILEFADLIMKIENHYGFPCDIEWALEKSKFYIVQSRPITTLKGAKQNNNQDNEYEPIFKFAQYNVFMTDMFFQAYGELNPIVTIKNGQWTFFLTKDQQDRLAEEGYNLALKDGEFDQLERKMSEINNILAKSETIDVSILDNDKFIKFLKQIFSEANLFAREYRKTEYIYFTKVERELKDKFNDKFQDVVSGKIKIDLDEKTKKLLEYFVKIQHFKLKMREVINNSLMGEESLFSRLLTQIVLRTNRQDSPNMTLREIIKCLNDEEVADVSERYNFSFIIYNDGLNITSGPEADKLIEHLHNYSEEIKGVVACKGKARGKAKIIPLSLDPNKYLQKMEQGDILVSDTTGPEMMTAIRKASAIVTDEGGLMSHAAVVAREFGIPCIVGTKYGTLVIKDGDLVEVDANNGIIKIIKNL